MEMSETFLDLLSLLELCYFAVQTQVNVNPNLVCTAFGLWKLPKKIRSSFGRHPFFWQEEDWPRTLLTVVLVHFLVSLSWKVTNWSAWLEGFTSFQEIEFIIPIHEMTSLLKGSLSGNLFKTTFFRPMNGLHYRFDVLCGLWACARFKSFFMFLYFNKKKMC